MTKRRRSRHLYELMQWIDSSAFPQKYQDDVNAWRSIVESQYEAALIRDERNGRAVEIVEAWNRHAVPSGYPHATSATYEEDLHSWFVWTVPEQSGQPVGMRAVGNGADVDEAISNIKLLWPLKKEE